MATTYTGWVADGRPWKNCQPINDFIATLRAHGYTGPGVGIGDQSHLTANPPEDHCPFSHTPWPGAQPYPFVLAIDIMPKEGLNIIDLGGRLFDDKSSNVVGTEPIKYINWTDTANNCWHDSWMPRHTRFTSTDRGHIHISFRTDYVTSNRMKLYDPYGGVDPGPVPLPPEEEYMKQVLVRYSDAPSADDGVTPGYMRVFLADGMRQHELPADFFVLPPGGSLQPKPGIIGNDGTHAEAMLGNLGNGGQIFLVGTGGWADRDAWGAMDVPSSGNSPGNFTITFEGQGTAQSS